MENLILIIIGVVVIILIYLLIVRNKLVKLNNNVNEAFSVMDVYLKKRWDLIPNLVETVKGYAKQEKEVLTELTEIRKNSSYDDLSNKDKITKNEEITRNISKLMLLVEAYPDLKANKNFLSLGEKLSSIEDEIAQSRKYYNAVVREFNNKVEMFPSNIVAKIFKYDTKQMFLIDDNEKENVEVNI